VVNSLDVDKDDIDNLVEFQLETVKSNRYKYLKPRLVYWCKGNRQYLDGLDYNQSNNENGVLHLPWLTETEFQQKYRVT
jgi:hypothetical protein